VAEVCRGSISADEAADSLDVLMDLLGRGRTAVWRPAG
jgi:biotin operon repressor